MDPAGLKPAGDGCVLGIVAEVPLDHVETMAACQVQQLNIIAALGSIAAQALVMLNSPQKILESFSTHRLDQPNSARCST